VPTAAECPLNVVSDTSVQNERNVIQVANAAGERKFKEFAQSALTPSNAIINLKISPGAGLCFDPKTEPKFASNKFYPFQREPEKGCEKDEMQTSVYEKLGEGTELEVYRVNKV
jgi:hypothetical protein